MNAAYRSLLPAILFGLSLSAYAEKPPTLVESSDKIYEIVDGVIVIPALDPRNQQLQPKLRQDGVPVELENLQRTFLEQEGLAKYKTIWVFSPESGEVRQVKSGDLKMEWGKSTGDNIHFSAGLASNVCRGNECLAIMAMINPFKSSALKPIEFSDPPKNINPKMFGLREADFGAVRLNYSKRPNGAEIVVVETFKQDAKVNCGEAGVANTVTGYVRSAGGPWHEIYSKFNPMEPMELTKSSVAKFARPRASVGVPTSGDEVILIESTFIFLDKNKPLSMTTIRESGPSGCNC